MEYNLENFETKAGVFVEIDNHIKDRTLDIYELLSHVPKEFFDDKFFSKKVAIWLDPCSVLEFLPVDLQQDVDFLCDLAKLDGPNLVDTIYYHAITRRTFISNPQILISAIENCLDDVLLLDMLVMVEMESKNMLEIYPEIAQAYDSQMAKIYADSNPKRPPSSMRKVRRLLAEVRPHSFLPNSPNFQVNENDTNLQKNENNSNLQKNQNKVNKKLPDMDAIFSVQKYSYNDQLEVLKKFKGEDLASKMSEFAFKKMSQDLIATEKLSDHEKNVLSGGFQGLVQTGDMTVSDVPFSSFVWVYPIEMSDQTWKTLSSLMLSHDEAAKKDVDKMNNDVMEFLNECALTLVHGKNNSSEKICLTLFSGTEKIKEFEKLDDLLLYIQAVKEKMSKNQPND